MPTPIIRFPLDSTGINPNNLVINEPHILDSNVQIRAIAPIYGAFYENSLVITDTATNTILVKSQYSPVDLLQDATMLFGQGIYMVVLITDLNVSSTISVNYQVLGGEYQNSAQAVITAYQNTLSNNSPVDWSKVLNKPTQYPPSLHMHLMADVYGFQSVIAELERIRNAIILTNIPELQAVIDWAWGNWGFLSNMPFVDQNDIDTATPSKKLITFDYLINFLDKYKGGNNIHLNLNNILDGAFRVKVNIDTYNYRNGTNLYWTIANISTALSDFTTTAGMFTIQNNSSSFTVQLTSNIAPMPATELFRIQIRTNSPTGPVIALSDAITIAPIYRISTVTPALLFDNNLYYPGINITPNTFAYIMQ